MIPGPRDSTRRPRRKITPRSYSFRTLSPLMTKAKTKMTIVAAGPNIPSSFCQSRQVWCIREWPHREAHAIDAHNLDTLANRNRLLGNRIPVLAVDKDFSARGAGDDRLFDLADLAKQTFTA